MASRVDQLSFFEADDEPEAKERTNSCEDVHQSSQFEPLEIGEDSGDRAGAQAVETNSSKSAENSPKLEGGAPTTGNASKLLQIIEPSRVQAEEEIGRLTQDELKLFLKLCKNPNVAMQLGVSGSDAMTSSTVTSETSSQDNSYMPAPQVATSPAFCQVSAQEYHKTQCSDHSSTPVAGASKSEEGHSGVSTLFITPTPYQEKAGERQVNTISNFVADMSSEEAVTGKLSNSPVA